MSWRFWERRTPDLDAEAIVRDARSSRDADPSPGERSLATALATARERIGDADRAQRRAQAVVPRFPIAGTLARGAGREERR